MVSVLDVDLRDAGSSSHGSLHDNFSLMSIYTVSQGGCEDNMEEMRMMLKAALGSHWGVKWNIAMQFCEDS